ncbi:hypothetical protein SH661x_001751 [Planctomicrobium sp. SH661]|uniref:hypothetical protein n=1 Tax=Planctomicrobium sp. SH661 TaxID=3448124 RepID=UPI003F5CA0CA
MRICTWIAVISLLPGVAFADSLELLPKSNRSVRPRIIQDLEPTFEELAPRGEKIDVSTVIEPEVGVIDLRPPSIPLGDFGTPEEPSWLDGLIDDHLLIWHEVPIGTQVLPRAGTAFGMTSLGVKFDVVGKGPMWVSGNFGWNFLSGPDTAAVGPQTYDLGLELNYAKKFNDVWGVHLNVSPLLATDFVNNTSDAFRMLAGGLVSYQADDVTRLVAGISYLDRPDLNFLPIAGLKWSVTENLQVDMLVPRPRIAWRFNKEEVQESWLFLAGEVGGGSWAIERDPKLADRMGYRDLRCVGGIEYKQQSGGRSVFEAGYVFNRHIQFQSGPGDVNPGTTFVIRWGQFY